MEIIRPDLKKNPWIYVLMFKAAVAESTSIESTSIEKDTLNFEQFCEACNSINLKVKKKIIVSHTRSRSR
tara:strand:+ start:102 stop:311 length:210 start_codon:yes stop_codon:yes gene_type:complete